MRSNLKRKKKNLKSALSLKFVFNFQAKFGPGGSDSTFSLFQSDAGKNLLFKDSTKCLQEIPAGTSFEQFLGAEYMTAMTSLRVCGETAPGLYFCGLNQD